VNRNHLDEELMLCVFAGQDSLIMRVVTSDSVSAANQYTDEPENPDSSDDTEFWRKGMRTHQNVLIHIYIKVSVKENIIKHFTIRLH